jgi:hypothetical protein
MDIQLSENMNNDNEKNQVSLLVFRIGAVWIIAYVTVGD